MNPVFRAMENPSKLDGLKSWMQSNGIKWSASTVSLCGGMDGDLDFAITAACDIPEHETLCEIPKDEFCLFETVLLPT